MEVDLVKEKEPGPPTPTPRYHDGRAIESVLRARANMSWEDRRNKEATLKSNQSYSLLLHRTTGDSYWRDKYVSCF